MKCKITILYCLFIICGAVLNAQTFIETAPSGSTRDGSLIVYGMDGKNAKIPYERITGSPFWNPEWQLGALESPDGKSKGRLFVRLNLVTQEIHFKDSRDNELAADDGTVAKVGYLMDKDTVAVFRNDFGPINMFYNRNKKYAQIMNSGEYRLLKVTIREVKSADSMFGTLKRYYFSDRADYFIEHGNKIDKIKKLNKEEVLSLLPRGSALEAYVKQNKIKFAREEDLIKLLDEYNKITANKQP
jgi:hypothetical protein